MTSKVCTRCHIDKNLNEYSPQKKGRLGRSSWCRECASRHQKLPEKAARRAEIARLPARVQVVQLRQRKKLATESGWWRQLEYQIRCVYHLELIELATMYFAQQWKCAGCLRPLDGSSRFAMNGKTTDHIDHDHQTGKVRGVLCYGCDNVLGCMRDSIPGLYSLEKYLTVWQALKLPAPWSCRRRPIPSDRSESSRKKKATAQDR